AISSASSMARWIDCTVDSMLTTTPFFMPREGCDPMPTISSSPSSVTAPTIATTLEVPMSRPTIMRPSCPAITRFPHPTLSQSCCHLPPREFAPRRSWLPANGEAVAVAQVDIGDPRDLLLQAAAINPHEAAQLGQCIAGADAQVDATLQV